jgi:type I restriction enzyme S subunit
MKIRECATFFRGVSFKKNNSYSSISNDSIPIIRANNIIDNCFDFNDLIYVPISLVDKEQRIYKDDIVITMSSGSKTHVGKIALATKDLDVGYGAFLGKLKPFGIFSKYLAYLLQSNLFRNYIERVCKGTNINNIKQSHILDFDFSCPLFSEQERIVAKIEELFSELDSAVSELKNVKEKLQIYRQAVLSAAFSNADDKSMVTLDSISEISSGITKGRDLSKEATENVIELPYLRVANVQNGYLDLSEIKTIQLKVSEKEKYLLQFEDVLYTEGGDRDKLGRGTLWRNEIKDCVHQNHIFKARINREKALPLYVSLWSMSSFARNYFYNKGKQSVNLASINKTVLSKLPIYLPNINEQSRIVQDIEAKLSYCDNIEKTIDPILSKAAALRQSILKQAFEGKL